MAQNTTHRRMLATPDAEPLNPPSSSMDPTLKKRPKPTSTHQNNKNSDPGVPSSTSFYMSSSHLSKTSLKPNKNTTCVDTLSQAKAMTKSADFDESGRLQQPTKPKQQRHRAGEPKVGKEIKPTTTKERTAKEKVKVKTLSHEEEEKKEVYFVAKGSSNNKEVKDPNFVVEGHELKRLSLGGRRGSFCGAQVELGDFLANNGAKIVAVDMPPFMQIHAVDCARRTHDSLEKFSSKTLALTLKKEFDGVYGPAWHCIVGTSFGSFVTHSVGGFLYFSMDQKLYMLLFKTTVQRAD